MKHKDDKKIQEEIESEVMEEVVEISVETPSSVEPQIIVDEVKQI